MQFHRHDRLLAEIEADTSIDVSTYQNPSKATTDDVVRRAHAVVAPVHQAPTLIGCSIVKEQFAPAHVASQTRRSRKRRDYRAALI
jgi:hypothetical protein